jgi:hypothetical protein
MCGMIGRMKSNPKISSEFEKFSNFVRRIVNVPGKEVKQQIEREKLERKKKKRAKTSSATRQNKS